MKSWRDEMQEEVDRINQELPNTPTDQKTIAIRRWIGFVLRGMEHYKAKHRELLKEAMTLLELALWKANLEENESNNIDAETQRWIRSVLRGAEHYKVEHIVLVKEAMVLLELALRKANIDEIDGNESELTMVQRKRVRQERRITSGASIVIKNVLPFLQLDITT
jgi:hypothetical protein